MSKEKLIEEMTEILEHSCERECPKPTNCDYCQAVLLYNAGYRKQSEGEWVKFRLSADDTANRWKCSVCKSERHEETDYCPNCGAKMKGGDS